MEIVEKIKVFFKDCQKSQKIFEKKKLKKFQFLNKKFVIQSFLKIQTIFEYRWIFGTKSFFDYFGNF